MVKLRGEVVVRTSGWGSRSSWTCSAWPVRSTQPGWRPQALRSAATASSGVKPAVQYSRSTPSAGSMKKKPEYSTSTSSRTAAKAVSASASTVSQTMKRRERRSKMPTSSVGARSGIPPPG